MKVIECPISIRITNEDISNIINKALGTGGGSLHWVIDTKPKYNNGTPINEVIANDEILILYAMNGATYELTRDKFMLGVQQALPYLDNAISGINLAVDAIDCVTGDLIVQLAIFNELKYD